jgi:outer membrane protein OmpA-like peptidoglycan-associated protein
MRNLKTKLSVVSLAGAITLAILGGAAATELQILQGTPSAQQLEDALAPKQAASTVRFRGITLGNQAPKQTTTATPAAAPGAPPQAAPAAPATKVAAPAAEAKPVQAVSAVAINIMFDFNSDRVTPQGAAILDNLGKALNSERLRGSRFLLEGHTDSKGSAEYNQALSERRAKAAKDFLVANHKIEAARLQTVGKGKTEPLDPANPERDINRRVQIMNLGS